MASVPRILAPAAEKNGMSAISMGEQIKLRALTMTMLNFSNIATKVAMMAVVPTIGNTPDAVSRRNEAFTDSNCNCDRQCKCLWISALSKCILEV